MHCLAWNEPAEPVKPWTMTFESFPRRIAMLVPLLSRATRRLYGLLGGLPQVLGRDDRDARVLEQFAPLLDVRALEADDERHFELDLLEGAEDAGGDHVALDDAAEDVDQDGLDLGVLEDDLECAGDALL